MTYAPVTDHISRGLAKLLAQFNGPKQRAMAAVYLRQVQALEDFANLAGASLSLSGGFGITLDRIGKIVGRGRNGLSDTDYLVALRAQIRINRSQGTVQDMIDVMTLSLADPVHAHPAFSIAVKEIANTAMQVTILTALIDSQVAVLFQNAKATKMGGVRLEFIFSEWLPSATFAFAPTLTASNAHGAKSTTKGFSWAAAPTGGHLAGEFAT